MNVKICGITNLPDAEEAVRLGAWAIGLVHYGESPRRCDPAAAAEVGGAVENAGLIIVQLNGEQGPSFCTEVARRTGTKVIKAIHTASAADVQAAETYRTDFHLFDTRRPALWGGTGETFDWGLVAARRSSIPMIIAGGLQP